MIKDVREGRVRLKEIVFYNLITYLFNSIEILIMKINYFLKIYKGKKHPQNPQALWFIIESPL